MFTLLLLATAVLGQGMDVLISLYVTIFRNRADGGAQIVSSDQVLPNYMFPFEFLEKLDHHLHETLQTISRNSSGLASRSLRRLYSTFCAESEVCPGACGNVFVFPSLTSVWYGTLHLTPFLQ